MSPAAVITTAPPSPESTTSCGRRLVCPDSRERNWMPSALVATNTNANVPVPETREVTSYSTQPFDTTLPVSASTPVVGAGRLFQVIPPSLQLVLVPYKAGPS